MFLVKSIFLGFKYKKNNKGNNSINELKYLSFMPILGSLTLELDTHKDEQSSDVSCLLKSLIKGGTLCKNEKIKK